MRPRPLLVTHSGTFHLDDVFAYCVLRLALELGLPEQGHDLVRTRDPDVITSADIVWDVGAVYDPTLGRFDHHQRGAPFREDDGTPLSAAGLVWRTHGEAAVRAVLITADSAGDLAPPIAAAIDAELVRRIDLIDNGVVHPEDTLGLSSLVADWNRRWNAPAIGVQFMEDATFLRAVDLVQGVLARRVEAVGARLAADAEVVAAHKRSADPRVLELERKMPWHDAVFAHDLPVLYAIYPVPRSGWIIDAMPPAPNSYAQRLPLPEAWAGLRDEALAEVSGVSDAMFVHPKRFVGGARSREGAVAMAVRAMG